MTRPTMQTNTNWQKVKEQIRRNRKPIEQEFGLKVGKGKGEWTPVFCPLHDDRTASASISRSGGIKCHVCSPGKQDGLDVFQWVAKLKGISELQALELVAGLYGVSTELKKVPRRQEARKKRSALVTPKLVAEAAQALRESDEPRAKFFRGFLAERGISPEDASTLEFGYLDEMLVAFQRYADGSLRNYYRYYDWHAQKSKGEWRWAGNQTARKEDAGSVTGLWPLVDLDRLKQHPDAPVWIVEGEWDAAAARCVLRWQEAEHPIFVYASNGGAGQKPHLRSIPPEVMRHPIRLLLDNDFVQHPDPREWTFDDSNRRQEFELRQLRFFEQASELHDEIAEMTGEEIDMRVMAVPIKGDVKWGADLRDWIEGGGRDPKDFLSWDIETIRPGQEAPIECDFEEVGSYLNHNIIVECTVDAITDENVIVPLLSELECAQGSAIYCRNCDAPVKYDHNGYLVKWKMLEREAYSLTRGRDAETFIKERILGKPSRCQTWELKHKIHSKMKRWFAGPPRKSYTRVVPDDDRIRAHMGILVVSEQSPPVSGNARITGRVIEHQGTVAIFATKIETVSRVKLDLTQAMDELVAAAQPQRTLDEVRSSITKIARDVGANITGIYDQDDLHIAALMCACSTLWFRDPVTGELVRGWIDCAIVGDTGAGKSPIFKAIAEVVGGSYNASGSMTSRAGFLVGSVRDHRVSGYVSKIGIYPKEHGGMMAVDEAHLMPRDVMEGVQSARSDGVVQSAKAGGGDRDFACCVRTVWILNYYGGQRDTFGAACQHIARFCNDREESIRRFDYCLRAEAKNWKQSDEPSLLGSNTLHCLVQRAWLQTERDVVIEPDAAQLARDICDDMAEVYWQKEIPMFVRAEKPLSILRQAIAVANLLNSYDPEHPQKVIVRRPHVEFAAEWLRYTYKSIEYDTWSRRRRIENEVRQPYAAEHLIFRGIGSAGDPIIETIRRANSLLGSFTKGEIQTLFPDIQATDSWLAKARALNVVTLSKGVEPGRGQRTLKLSGEAVEILNRTEQLYRERGEYAVQHRWSVLEKWVREGGRGEPSIPSLLDDPEEVTEYDYPDRREDIGEAEPVF